MSTGNEPSQTYNPSEEALANLSLRTIVADVLAVSVQKGPMLPKFPGDEKLHHSYEVTIASIHSQTTLMAITIDASFDSSIGRNVICSEIECGF